MATDPHNAATPEDMPDYHPVEVTPAEPEPDDNVWDIGKSNAREDAYWRRVHFPKLYRNPSTL